MQYLVSTTKTQGQRKNDFHNTDEKEILRFTSECDGERIDGKCGCRRSMAGVNSHKATTTFEVVEGDIDLLRIIIDYYHNSLGKFISHLECEEYAVEDSRILSTVADAFPVGAIIERRGSKFVMRE